MNSSRRVLAALLALPACAAPTAQMNLGIGETITAMEFTEDGEALKLPAVGIVEVDINSKVYLRMNTDEVIKSLFASSQVDREELASSGEELEKIKDLLVLHKEMIDKLAYIANLAAAGRPISVSESAALGRLQLRAVDGIEAFARSREEDVDHLYSRPGYVDVERYLNERKREATEKHHRLVSKLSGVKWRVEASLTSGDLSTPIHLDNYDTHQAGAPRVIDKLGPIFGKEQREQYAKAQELVRTAASLGDSTKAWLQQIPNLAKRTAVDMVAFMDTLKDLQEIQKDLRPFGKSAPEIESLLQSLETGLAANRGLVQKCGDVGKRLEALSSSMDASLVAIGVIDVAKECKDALRDQKTSRYVSAIHESAKALVEAAENPKVAAGLKGSMRDRVERASKATSGLKMLLDNWDRIELSQYDERLKEAAVAEGPQFTDRAHGQIADTAIELIRTPRAEGDLVRYRASVVVDGEASTAGMPVDLKVVRNGLHVDISPGAIFVRPNDYVKGKEKALSPAPVLTAAAHYRIGRADGEAVPTGLSKVWNVLNPGLGFHVATPVLGKRGEKGGEPAISDAALGFGIGGTVQLLGDVAQAGIGYDVQSARSYAFFGLGLHTLTNLGATFPGNTGAAER